MAIKMGDPIELGSEGTMSGAEGARSKRGGRLGRPMMGLASSGTVSLYGEEKGRDRKNQGSGDGSPEAHSSSGSAQPGGASEREDALSAGGLHGRLSGSSSESDSQPYNEGATNDPRLQDSREMQAQDS